MPPDAGLAPSSRCAGQSLPALASV